MKHIIDTARTVTDPAMVVLVDKPTEILGDAISGLVNAVSTDARHARKVGRAARIAERKAVRDEARRLAEVALAEQKLEQAKQTVEVVKEEKAKASRFLRVRASKADATIHEISTDDIRDLEAKLAEAKAAQAKANADSVDA